MALNHLAPFVPERDGPWDARAAAHLLRRAGFGAALAETARAVGRGLGGTVAQLFDEGKGEENEFQETFRRLSGAFVDFGDAGQLQAWWCYRMRRTAVPLREKLTLFWHGHFAASYKKVEDVFLMHQQCETLRRLAWGNVRDLVLAVSRDPATLVDLDGEGSTKDRPNENFARELLERFTLGVGNYVERDVRETARAFTGWHRDGTRFAFKAEAHDDGPKEILGRKGNLGGVEVIDALAGQPALPRFLARKLFAFFACPEPPDEVVAEAADVFRAGGLSVQHLLKTLFLSKFFYGPACRRTRIASPVEFVIGTCRALGVRMAAQELRDHVNAMGQELFAPPGARGWDGERAWVHANSWVARQAFGQRVGDVVSGSDFGPHLDVGALVPDAATEPRKVAAALNERVLEGGLSRKKVVEVAEFLIAGDDGPKPDEFRANADFRAERVRAAVGVLLSLAEAQTY